MSVQLFHGDCLDIMPTLPDKSIDMILADLPYGTTACKWDSIIPFEKLWPEYKRLIKDNGAIVLFGSEPFSSVMRMSNLKMYKYDWVWEKSKATGFLNVKKRPLVKHELISVFCNKTPSYFPVLGSKQIKRKPSATKKAENRTDVTYGKYKDGNHRTISNDLAYPKSIIQFNTTYHSREGSFHPTQKPVEILEYLIKTYTLESKTVLDNTMGSGSTGVACVNTNRNFIGIEKDENYFKIAKERIEKAKPKIESESILELMRKKK